MKLTKIYDSRTIDDVLNKKPIVFKAEFKDKDGNKYLGWKYPKGQSHWTGMNYNSLKYLCHAEKNATESHRQI